MRRMKTPADLQSEPEWHGRLIAMCTALRSDGDAERMEIHAKAWNLLRDSLLCALGREARRHRSVTREDLEDVEDVVSAKALDLLSRSENEVSLQPESSLVARAQRVHFQC